VRPLNDTFLRPDDFDSPEELQTERTTKASIVGVCAIIGIVVVGMSLVVAVLNG
jgi:hypothetical protein